MNIKLTSIFFIVLVMLIVNEARAWEVDFSRRRQPASPPATTAPPDDAPTAASSDGVVDVPAPAPHVAPTDVVDNQRGVALPPSRSYSKGLDSFVTKHNAVVSGVDRQELVILNTGKGFVPSNVRLRQGVHYLIHVVNVNEDKKNVSFIMDAFNQHYATYYGQIKTFNLDPDKEGIFEFECPETSSSGKLVVFGPGNPTQSRTVSSEK